MKSFKPTKLMIDAAQTLFEAMAFRDTIKPIVLEYQIQALTEGQFKVRPEFAVRGRSEDEVITNPEHSYLMSDEDFVIYHQKCKKSRDAAGLFVDHDDNCPLLVADSMVVDAQHNLINVMEELTHIKLGRLVCHLPQLRKYIDLTLRLLAPFVSNKISGAV